MIKRFFLIAALLLTFLPRPASAECACYNTTADDPDRRIFRLLDSEGLDDDECEQICLTETDTCGGPCEGGSVYDKDDREQEKLLGARFASDTFTANGQCLCYCGDTASGSKVAGGQFQLKEECQSWCEEGGKKFITCATSAQETPTANLLCFSPDECAEVGGQWSPDQPAECETANHYCYPTPEAIQLTVHLGETTQVYNIGEFIRAAYTYSLGAAAIIAVVMMMIGGVQYIFGGASKELIDKAKSRISNAVIGLTLILLAYTVLSTVNPYLVEFKTIELPLIKPALFVNGSCERYRTQKYLVSPEDPDETECGDSGSIIQAPNGATAAGTCVYESCLEETSLKSAKCAQTLQGYDCLTCGKAFAQSAGLGFRPSESSCAALTPSAEVQTGGQLFQCLYSKDVNLAQSMLDDLGISVVAFPLTPFLEEAPSTTAALAVGDQFEQLWNGTCGLVELDCAAITDCTKYDDVKITASTDEGRVFTAGELDDIEDWHQKICESNPCYDVNKNANLKDGCRVLSSGSTSLGVGILDCFSTTDKTYREFREEQQLDLEELETGF